MENLPLVVSKEKTIREKKFNFDRLFLLLMISPAAIILLIFTAFPIINLLNLMLSKVELSDATFSIEFTGFENISRLLTDAAFFSSMGKTLVYMVGSVGGEVILGTALALLVSQGLKVSGPFRAILLLPMVISPVAVGLIWRLMYNPEFGLFNAVLKGMGLPTVGWLSDPNVAMASIILSDIWQWTAFVYLIVIAGLESLPKDPLEAADVDGASAWQKFWQVTLPMLAPTLIVAVMFRAMDALKAFDKFVVLTSGGPGDATEIASLYAYKVTFRYWEIGYGSLMSFILVVLGALISWGLNRVIYKKVGGSNE
ncbi:carbohydrate ABC transporter permease [Neobacillus sp. 19]|uniref:carbohydrate ABC transporter permease n=1 Tax=Neobacillus sp. 19 TaxID=3394458 RepID=UPI003BF65F88